MGKRKGMAPRTIRRLRARFDETQKQFAERLGTTHEVVHRWEAGKAEPRPTSLRLLQMAKAEADELGL